MRKTAFFKPYDKTGKNTNLKKFMNKAGVYLIKESGKLTYIGYSAGNLYKTITRHFQTWNDPTQPRFFYERSKCTIRVVLTTPKQAAALEETLIQKYKPTDNKLKLNLYSERERKRIIEDFESAAEIDPF